MTPQGCGSQSHSPVLLLLLHRTPGLPGRAGRLLGLWVPNAPDSRGLTVPGQCGSPGRAGRRVLGHRGGIPPTLRGDRSDVPGPGGRFTLCWCCGPRKVPPEPAISTPKTGSTVSERTSCQGSAFALRGACQAAVLPRCPLAPCAQAREGFRGKGPQTRGAWGASFLSASSSLVIMPFAETGRETGVGCADRGLLRLAWAPPGGRLAPGRSPFGFASRLCTLSMWHLSAIPANNQLNLRSTTRLATGGPSTLLTPFRSLGLRAGEGFRTQFLSAQAESLGQPYCGPRDGPVHTPPWKWATTWLSSCQSSLAFGIVLVLPGARLTGSLVATDLSLGSLVLPLTYEPVNAVCPVL